MWYHERRRKVLPFLMASILLSLFEGQMASEPLNHFFPLFLAFYLLLSFLLYCHPNPKLYRNGRRKTWTFYRMHLMNIGRKKDKSLCFIFFPHAKGSKQQSRGDFILQYLSTVNFTSWCLIYRVSKRRVNISQGLCILFWVNNQLCF